MGKRALFVFEMRRELEPGLRVSHLEGTNKPLANKTLGPVFHDERSPGPKVLKRIAKALKCSEKFLLTGELGPEDAWFADRLENPFAALGEGDEDPAVDADRYESRRRVIAWAREAGVPAAVLEELGTVALKSDEDPGFEFWKVKLVELLEERKALRESLADFSDDFDVAPE